MVSSRLGFIKTVSERDHVDVPEQKLEPLSYHVGLRDNLKSHERELWTWFASVRAQADCAEGLRPGRLESMHRLDVETVKAEVAG